MSSWIDEDLIDGIVKELRVVNSPEGPTHPHPSKFVSHTSHIVTRLYTYMIYHRQHEVEATGWGGEGLILFGNIGGYAWW